MPKNPHNSLVALDCPGIALALSGALTPEVDLHIAGSVDPEGETS